MVPGGKREGEGEGCIVWCCWLYPVRSVNVRSMRHLEPTSKRAVSCLYPEKGNFLIVCVNSCSAAGQAVLNVLPRIRYSFFDSVFWNKRFERTKDRILF